jgi:hypothetical protein
MPAAALALSEYLGGALGSSISERVLERGDNKDSATSLGDPEMPSVEHPPRDAIPELDHFPEEATEIASAIATEEPRDVFQQ